MEAITGTQESHIATLEEKVRELHRENRELRRQQVEISTAKELYLKILEDFPALIWRSRLDKLCDYFNKTWLDFTGRTMEQEFGNGWAEGVHPDDFDYCLDTYVKAFDKRAPFMMEYRMKNKLGDYCWIRDYGQPFFDLDESFLGYIGSCYDVTKEKNDENRIKELNQKLEKLFSIIRHDIKSPLMLLSTLSDRLDSQIKAEDYASAKEIGDIIKISSKESLSLLQELMEWSSQKSEKLDCHPEVINLQESIGSVIDLLKANTDEKQLCVDLSITRDSLVMADKKMIKTVFRNIIGNAIKFTPREGKIHIKTSQGEDTVTIEISDTGVGISKSQMIGLFDANQEKSTLGTENETGTGLGLSLCREFILKNGGKIWVDSIEGTGSTFFIQLPRA